MPAVPTPCGDGRPDVAARSRSDRDRRPRRKTPADFWFDPLCPWAWMTSRWMLEVEKVRAGRRALARDEPRGAQRGQADTLPEQLRATCCDTAWGPVRVVIAAQQEHGDEVVGPLYDALGTRYHNRASRRRARPSSRPWRRSACPPSWPTTPTATRTTTELRACHKEGIDKVGQDVGTPVIAVPGSDGEQIAFFGPVVTPAPKGEDAARLWDGTLLVAVDPRLLRDQAHPHRRPELRVGGRHRWRTWAS